MKYLTLICLLLLSACSTQIVEMTAEPTVQEYNLSDPEGDGVISARDDCLESATGAQVSNSGCGTESIETIRRKLEINFDVDSYVVNDEYLPEIEGLAIFMVEFPQAKVTIEGHTSIRGSADYNLVLSQQRADMVKTILVNQFGIMIERIDAVGYGFEQLLEEGDDDAIHARNRRIVAELSIDKSYTDMKWNIYSVDSVAE